MKEQVRLGFIGAGNISRSHKDQLKTFPDVKMIAHSDPNPAAVENAAKIYGGNVYSDYRDMLEKEKLDAVLIALPPSLHGTIEVDCAQRGIHMLVEKPVTLFLDQGRRAAEAIRKAGVIASAGYNLRHMRGAHQLRELARRYPIPAARTERWFNMRQPAGQWWRQYAKSGGQLVDQGTHDVDLMRFVLGEVKSVQAQYGYTLSRKESDVTIPDTQAVTLVFENGAIATLHLFCMMAGVQRATTEFWARDAAFRYGPEKVEVVSANPIEVPAFESPLFLPRERAAVDRRFIEAVKTGDSSILVSSYEDALETTEVCLAANRSAENGGVPVSLPLAA